MKKRFLIFSILLSAAFSNAQTGDSCTTAKSFDPSQPSADYENQTQQSQWYWFQSTNTQVKIDLFNTFNVSGDKVNKITLWAGSCGNLIMVAFDTLTNPSDSILSITATSITKNTIYYLKVDKSTNTDLIKYSTNFSYKFSASCFDCIAPIVNACDLICNGSFEEGANPSNWSQLDYACAWLNATGATPDYMNSLGGPNVSVPSNGAGIQSANTGSAYAGIIAYGPQPFGNPPWQEYFSQELRCPLIAGVTYSVSFYVSLSDYSGYSTDALGAWFTDAAGLAAVSSTITTLPVTPQIINTSGFITNSSPVWTLITGSFVATGSETTIVIGNFGTNNQPTGTGSGGITGVEFDAYYYIDDVSVTPINTLTVAATPNPVNCGQVFTLTNNLGLPLDWSSSGGYSCTNCFNPVTSVASNTLFNGTITYCTGCSYTASTTVTVNPVPTVAVASPATICVGSSSTLTASGATTYSWSSGPATASYTVNPLITTTYTVTGTTGACSSTATVTVTVDPSCCTGAFTANPGFDVTGSTFASGLTSFTGTTIAVNSNLTIGAPTNFTNCILRFAPDKKIIILSGQMLTINKSQLYSCGLQMWDGIEIKPGGNLIIQDKSLVEDAKIAVYSDNTGAIANFFIEKTTFNRNYIGVKVANYSGGTLHPGIIRSSTFHSVSSFTSTPNTAFLDSPYSGQTAEEGVYLFNVNSIQIGDPSLPSYQNDFIYLRVGIHADGSVYSAYNNSFHNNFLSPYCGVCHGATGWAIWNNKTKAVIGGSLSGQSNKFKDITNGILHENGYYLEAFYNTFVNMIYGYPYSGGTAILTRNFTQGGVIHITRNDIKDVNIGLYHINNYVTNYRVQKNLFKNFNNRGIRCVQNTNGVINILTNDFNQTATSAYTGNIAIEVGSAVTSIGVSPLVNISNNTIYRVNKGVLLTNIRSPKVINNTIVFKSTITPFPNFYYGIRALNGDNETINLNIISKDGANPTSTFENSVYGISVEGNLTRTTVTENNTAKLGTGLRFRSYTNANSDIRCNIMNRNFAGLGLDNVRVGDQGLPATITPPFPGDAADNSWTNPALVTSSVSVRGAGLTSPFDAFYTRSAAYPWCPSNLSINPTGSITTITNAGLAYYTPSAPTNCSNLCGTPPYPICMHSPSLAKIARNEAPFDAITGTKRYLMHEGVLRGVLSDSIPLDTTTVDGLDLKTFINNELASTTVGQLVNVGIKYADGDTTGAMALNASVVTTSCVDDYHKIVNTIFFNTWGIGNFNISSADSTTLYNIAIQDPLNCGTAIYDARVMLGIDINDFSTPGHMMMDPFETMDVAVEDKIGVLYPNPAQSSCTYEATLTDAQSGFVMMYDLNGKLLLSYKLNSGDNKLEMDLSGFANGVYMYQIVINGEAVDHKKLVISK